MTTPDVRTLGRLGLLGLLAALLVCLPGAPALARWHRAADLTDSRHPPIFLTPAVATNHHGWALVVWTCVTQATYPDQPIDRICARQRTGSGHWRPTRAVAPLHGLAAWPVVAMNRRGDAVIGWSTGGAGSTVMVRRLHRDGRLGPLVFPGGGGIASSVAIDDHGDVVVGYKNYDTGVGYVSVLRPGHPPTEQAELGTPVSSDPRVVMSRSGAATVVWGAAYEVDARVVHLDGTVGDLVDLSGSTLPSMADDARPFLDARGGLVVTWYDGGQSSNENVLVVRRSATGVVGSPQVVTAGDPEVVTYDAGVAADGSVDVGWLHGIQGRTYVRHLTASDRLGPRHEVAARAAYVTMSVAPDGSGLMTWGRAGVGSRLVGSSAKIYRSGRVAPPRRMAYTEGFDVAHLVRHRYLAPAALTRGLVALVGP